MEGIIYIERGKILNYYYKLLVKKLLLSKSPYLLVTPRIFIFIYIYINVKTSIFDANDLSGTARPIGFFSF